MKLAETVTFGGSGLDRAAELRGDRDALGRLQQSVAARSIVFWRNKPMVLPHGDVLELVRVPMDHPLVVGVQAEPLFLGREGDAGLWAVDLAGWEPENVDEAAINTFLDPTRQSHPDAPQGAEFAELRAVMTQLSARDCELAAMARGLFSWHEIHPFCAKCGGKSAPAMAGWQRTCPACGAHHFPRTDPVVIMLITHGNDVLIGRSPGWPEGMYSLLAGFIEPGETMEAAVRREVWEEAHVAVGPVGYLASQPWPFPASLMLGCHGEATSREIKVDPTEIEDALWVSRERMAVIMAGDDPDINPARNGAIAHFLIWHWLSDQLD